MVYSASIRAARAAGSRAGDLENRTVRKKKKEPKKKEEKKEKFTPKSVDEILTEEEITTPVEVVTADGVIMPSGMYEVPKRKALENRSAKRHEEGDLDVDTLELESDFKKWVQAKIKPPKGDPYQLELHHLSPSAFAEFAMIMFIRDGKVNLARGTDLRYLNEAFHGLHSRMTDADFQTHLARWLVQKMYDKQISQNIVATHRPAINEDIIFKANPIVFHEDESFYPESTNRWEGLPKRALDDYMRLMTDMANNIAETLSLIHI